MRKILDTDNGEIVGELNFGDKIVRAKSIDYLNDTIELGEGEIFAKIYLKPMFALARNLNGTEAQFVNYLMYYISYTSGILAHENGKPLRRQTMSMETGQDLRTIDRILNSLIEKQVIGKHKTGKTVIFTANPFIFMRGKRVSETLYKLYQNTKWAKMHKQ